MSSCSCCILYHFLLYFSFFFFNDTATTEIYTLSLHDALPISILSVRDLTIRFGGVVALDAFSMDVPEGCIFGRSEEHTSELQSHSDLVCRLLLEKKKTAIHRCRTAIGGKRFLQKG